MFHLYFKIIYVVPTEGNRQELHLKMHYNGFLEKDRVREGVPDTRSGSLLSLFRLCFLKLRISSLLSEAVSLAENEECVSLDLKMPLIPNFL